MSPGASRDPPEIVIHPAMSDLYSNYLRDLGQLVREAAVGAERDRLAAAGTEDASFQSGRSMAYYEMASLMRQQAIAFGLSEADIAFEGFNPDHDAI
jgi:hypothetical protein